MKFTIADNNTINTKVSNDLIFITSEILNLLGTDIHSILLYGGFGRSEGSVVFDGDKVHIVNDYDIFIVINEPNRLKYMLYYKKNHKSLEKLAVNLASELDIKQIDLGLKPLSYFCKQNELKIENYEVKSGNYLLYGEQNPTSLMPNWKAENIPLFEGTWLFRNRGAGMIIAALYFLSKDDILEKKKENFIVECTKAQLAMGDSILLMKGLYHHHYEERLKIIENLDVSDIPLGDEIVSNYKEAIKQKLKPDFNNYKERDLIEWWYQIVNLMNVFFHFYEQSRLNIKFESWYEYSLINKPESKFDLKIFVSKMVKKRDSISSISDIVKIFKISRRSYSISLIPLILFSRKNDSFNDDSLKCLSEILGIKRTLDDNKQWIEFAIEILLEIHPGGEAANAMELH